MYGQNGDDKFNMQSFQKIQAIRRNSNNKKSEKKNSTYGFMDFKVGFY